MPPHKQISTKEPSIKSIIFVFNRWYPAVSDYYAFPHHSHIIYVKTRDFLYCFLRSDAVMCIAKLNS